MTEQEKCKDPVYYYENYWLVDGKKPPALSEEDKVIMRAVASGCAYILTRHRWRGGGRKDMDVVNVTNRLLNDLPDFLKT